MPAVMTLDEIKNALERVDPLPLIEAGFVAYSRGQVVVPPIGEMIFADPPGDVHIKYGYIRGDDSYVIKIASGFYENPGLGLSSSNGLMLLFSQRTGELTAILLDEGHLTNVRTAAAGAVVAKYLAPRDVTRAGILGAGIQGRLQAEYLRRVRDIRELVVWGVNAPELAAYVKDMTPLGFKVRTTLDAREVADACRLIVTCTPSTRPLLLAGWIRPGTHITAMGSDTAEKQELDPAIFQGADRVVVDSLSQAELRGECYRAMKEGFLTKDGLVELGTVIEREDLQRQSDEETTVADLTGVAVQDIQISKAVWAAAQG
ncbi:MAG: ornithine cyclodeaminase family protein [Candidatus Aminicenantes bacterium]|nr:ornithine cyclodeaminase family protein [Candidatus Aminicenantes bacterium]